MIAPKTSSISSKPTLSPRIAFSSAATPQAASSP
jgi:hypothetical protein